MTDSKVIKSFHIDVLYEFNFEIVSSISANLIKLLESDDTSGECC